LGIYLINKPMDTKFTLKLVMGLFVVVILLGVGLLVRRTALQQKAPVNTSESVSLVVKPDFNYQITSISVNEVVLEGEKGSMTLPVTDIEVLKGSPPYAQEASIADLKEGNTVKLEFIAGQKAWMYIL